MIEDQADDRLCKVCFDIESEDRILIAPCRCSGTVKWIHEECLKGWLVSQRLELDKAACELCSTKYNMDFTVSFMCVPKCNVNNPKYSLFLPLLVYSSALILIMIFLAIMMEPGVSMAVLLGCCSMALGLASYFIFRYGKEMWREPYLKDWTIHTFHKESTLGIPKLAAKNVGEEEPQTNSSGCPNSNDHLVLTLTNCLSATCPQIRSIEDLDRLSQSFTGGSKPKDEEERISNLVEAFNKRKENQTGSPQKLFHRRLVNDLGRIRCPATFGQRELLITPSAFVSRKRRRESKFYTQCPKWDQGKASKLIKNAIGDEDDQGTSETGIFLRRSSTTKSGSDYIIETEKETSDIMIG